MKKYFWTTFILILVVLTSTAAYSSTKLKIGSNRLGTSFYVQGATVADVVNKYNKAGIEVEAMPIAGGVGNIKLIAQNKTLDFALTMNMNAMYAYKGICGFTEKAVDVRSILGGLDRYYIGLLANKKIQGNTLEEIVNNKPKIRLYTQEKGSTAELLASQLLESCGVTYDDIKAWGGDVKFVDAPSIINAFKDGYCDIFVLNINKGHPVVSELSLTGNLKFIQLSKKTVEFMDKKYGFIPDTLPANTYKGQDKPVSTGGSSTMIIANKSLNDDYVYEITKAVVEHKEDLIKGHKAFVDFDPDTASDPKYLGSMPLHPGAIKYFKEKGYIK